MSKAMQKLQTPIPILQNHNITHPGVLDPNTPPPPQCQTPHLPLPLLPTASHHNRHNTIFIFFIQQRPNKVLWCRGTFIQEYHKTDETRYMLELLGEGAGTPGNNENLGGFRDAVGLDGCASGIFEDMDVCEYWCCGWNARRE
ncbi:unnamed protein product [Tuber aestivum]|uniref:Uncharacterized protein n=1 Tax=Tuber aestivum TaxID=59557 RepID=A0A292Q0Y9_9PEZI|nr:unnamed protein product [Tuber aestivum]